jgi:hypothetical protein
MQSTTQESAFSQLVFVNTEAGFGTAGGNQIDRFKINFNTQPFEANDDSMLRLSVIQANVARNWYDVNESNNSIRFFNTVNTAINATDTILSLPVADYPNYKVLVDQWALVILDHLENNYFNGVTLTVTSTTDEYVASSHQTQGDAIPDAGGPNEYNLRKFKMTFVKSNGNGFHAIPVIQCLNIPTGDYTLTGATSPIPKSQQFNDSYILMGGKRIETFQQTPTISSFEVVGTNDAGAGPMQLTVTGYYLMPPTVYTIENLYLSCEVADNQATNNIVDTQEEHRHEATHSTILAKIPRTPEVGRSSSGIANSPYKLCENSNAFYFTNVSSNFLNSLIFKITDHRGRKLPVIEGSDVDGNVFLDMTLKVEKIQMPSSANLLNTGQPMRKAGQLNPSFNIVGTAQNDPLNLF